MSGRIDRDAARDGRLEEQVEPRRVGRLEQLAPLVREQLLVGGDHPLAVREGPEQQLLRRLDAAEDLDDDVDPGVVDDGHAVDGERLARLRHVARPLEVADGDHS